MAYNHGHVEKKQELPGICLVCPHVGRITFAGKPFCMHRTGKGDNCETPQRLEAERASSNKK